MKEMDHEQLCKAYWELWDRVQGDPEYARLKAALEELEPRYGAILAALSESDRLTLDRYITLRENLDRRMLEFACARLTRRGTIGEQNGKRPDADASGRFIKCDWVYKPGSVLTAIYLVAQLLTRSSRLLEAVGPTYCFSTALLRIEFTALQCSHGAGGLLHRLFTLTRKASGISLLHLS